MRGPTPILSRHAWPIVAALLTLYGAMAWTGVRNESATFDEMPHLTAGYSYWLTGDYRLDPENGILPQRWAALPLLFQTIRFPRTDQPAWYRADAWNLGYRFFYTLGNDLDRMLWWSRGMIVLFGMALGAVVYLWSRRLFGPAGGMISVIAYVFSPTCLAHGSLITSDMAGALAFTTSLACLWMVLHRVSVGRVMSSGVVMGLLFVSKMSAVLILPVALVVFAARVAIGRPLIVGLRRRHVVDDRPRQLVTLAGVAVVHVAVVAGVIWSFYGLHFTTFRSAEPGRDRMYAGQTIDSLTGNGLVGVVVRRADDLHLLPRPYLHGFAFAVHMSKTRTAFLNGERSVDGWMGFFPYCLMVKTPLAVFAVLLVAGAAVAVRRPGRRGQPPPERHRWAGGIERGVYRTLPIWVFLGVYWLVAIVSHLNIGHRHILPTYPAMFILCGAAGRWLRLGNRVSLAFVGLALAELALESLTIRPHYLAYFNQLAGGPRHGYRHLVDSSLDWGQDLPGLKRWLDGKQPASMKQKPVYLSYFGTASPEYHGLEVISLPSYVSWVPRKVALYRPGTYCISATMLQCIYTDPGGAWRPRYESRYRRVRTELGRILEQRPQDPDARGYLLDAPEGTPERERLEALLIEFDDLRFVRLCDYLRRREPDDSVGYSILIYYLNAQDLQEATN
jgi:4-amino-4-deoxy-L-arabinose transferase-like glycosyltransferase